MLFIINQSKKTRTKTRLCARIFDVVNTLPQKEPWKYASESNRNTLCAHARACVRLCTYESVLKSSRPGSNENDQMIKYIFLNVPCSGRVLFTIALFTNGFVIRKDMSIFVNCISLSGRLPHFLSVSFILSKSSAKFGYFSTKKDKNRYKYYSS